MDYSASLTESKKGPGKESEEDKEPAKQQLGKLRETGC